MGCTTGGQTITLAQNSPWTKINRCRFIPYFIQSLKDSAQKLYLRDLKLITSIGLVITLDMYFILGKVIDKITDPEK
jgi:hypothetical protein